MPQNFENIDYKTRKTHTHTHTHQNREAWCFVTATLLEINKLMYPI